jgi:MFS family permease
VGSVLGSLLGSPCYRYMNGDILLGASMCLQAITSFVLPGITSVVSLHIVYFAAGVATGLCDTGAIILINRIRGKNVGPWLIILQLGFNLGGFLEVLIDTLASLTVESLFFALGALLAIFGFATCALPRLRILFPAGKMDNTMRTDQVLIVDLKNKPQQTFSSMSRKSTSTSKSISNENADKVLPELNPDGVATETAIEMRNPHDGNNRSDSNETDVENGSGQSGSPESERNSGDPLNPSAKDRTAEGGATSSKRKNKDEPPKEKPYYYISEICLAIVILCQVGSGTAATAFLQPYAEKTNLVDVRTANLQVCMIWLAMTIGLAFSLFLRKYFFPTKEQVPYLFTFFTVVAAVGALLMIAIPSKENNSSILWLGLMLFGFFSKPCVGLAFQWIAIVTQASETSFAIAYVGLNSGAGIIPYITTALWNNLNGADSLFIVLFACMVISLPLFFASTFFGTKTDQSEQV